MFTLVLFLLVGENHPTITNVPNFLTFDACELAGEQAKLAFEEPPNNWTQHAKVHFFCTKMDGKN